ncbi:MAG: hypothetical protein JJU42_10945 [Rhodobacteraceae bacterium]|nr:hypothetical protein [Paracoccaceae bacterium]
MKREMGLAGGVESAPPAPYGRATGCRCSPPALANVLRTTRQTMEFMMEIDPVEMMALCIALLEHVAALGTALPGVDDGMAAAALPDMTAAMEMSLPDAEAAAARIDALRPMVSEMTADDLQEGAAFCLEMAEDL